jgi:pimeloyl-ACP methyl ester carboxylesterase
VPTRLLIGDGDPIGSPAMLAGWESHADDMTVDIVRSAGHFLPEEAPVEVAAAIDGLFGAPSGRRRGSSVGRRVR